MQRHGVTLVLPLTLALDRMFTTASFDIMYLPSQSYMDCSCLLYIFCLIVLSPAMEVTCQESRNIINCLLPGQK